MERRSRKHRCRKHQEQDYSRPFEHRFSLPYTMSSLAPARNSKCAPCITQPMPGPGFTMNEYGATSRNTVKKECDLRFSSVIYQLYSLFLCRMQAKRLHWVGLRREKQPWKGTAFLWQHSLLPKVPVMEHLSHSGACAAVSYSCPLRTMNVQAKKTTTIPRSERRLGT